MSRLYGGCDNNSTVIFFLKTAQFSDAMWIGALSRSTIAYL